MTDYELATDSDALLGDEHDAELFARSNAKRLEKVKCQRIGFIAASIAGLVLVVILLRFMPSLRHKKAPGLQDPVGDSPVTRLEPQFFHEYGSERVQIKYGPFTVPGSGENNGMKNFRIRDAKVPCHGCLITWMQAGLEFSDGSDANAATGMWLHHTLLFDLGKTALKSCKRQPERFFASGNERTVLDLTLNGTEMLGYWLGEHHNVSMATELMNELKYPQDAILTITYEYIPEMPSDFSAITSIWLDVGGCKDSEVPVPEDKTSFELSMAPWTSTVNGRVVAALSHLHDGGVHLDIMRDNENVCRSVASYDTLSKHGHDLRHMDMSHISYMSGCYDVGRIQEGEEWSLKAYYDIAAHKPMLGGDGKPEGVMGIAVLYIVED